MGQAQDHDDSHAEVEAVEERELTAEEQAEFAELQARRAAALREIRQYGDPVLRSEARQIEGYDEMLAKEAARMIDLMHDAMGIGLAAPQVGVSHRLLVYQVGDQRPVALVNPEVQWSSKESDVLEEGCLSLPGVTVDVERAMHVRVVATDVAGENCTIEASGLEARVIQHEMDHLDGVLILDRTSRDQRREAVRTLREAEDRTGYAA